MNCKVHHFCLKDANNLRVLLQMKIHPRECMIYVVHLQHNPFLGFWVNGRKKEKKRKISGESFILKIMKKHFCVGKKMFDKRFLQEKK